MSIIKAIGKVALTLCILPLVVLSMLLLPLARLIVGLVITFKARETGTAPQQILRVNHVKAV